MAQGSSRTVLIAIAIGIEIEPDGDTDFRRIPPQKRRSSASPLMLRKSGT
jgi:hypothetical protein